MRPRPYVGITSNGDRETFRSLSNPTPEVYGKQYTAVIGPFRTVRGAEFMRLYGRANPHLQTVADAERLAKEAL